MVALLPSESRLFARTVPSRYPASSISALPVSRISNGRLDGLIAEFSNADVIASAYSSTEGAVSLPGRYAPLSDSLKRNHPPDQCI